MGKKTPRLVISLSKGEGKKGEWDGYSDRDSVAETLADAGALVVENINKGVDFLVAASDDDESSYVEKAKKLKINVVKPSFIKAIQSAAEEGRKEFSTTSSSFSS
jgi:NAD-dependent DNA ligase